MSILADVDIRAYCRKPIFGDVTDWKSMIDPFSEPVQGGGVISYGLSHAGYDLRLGGELWVFKNSYNEIIDPKRFRDESYRRRVFDVVTPALPLKDRNAFDQSSPLSQAIPAGAYVIPPHSYALGVSLEYLCIPTRIKGRCVGKSTLARCGILINTTPLEPGWEGNLTIEISNITPCPALVYAGEGIAQLEFEELSSTPITTYAGKKYQGQKGVTPARVVE